MRYFILLSIFFSITTFDSSSVLADEHLFRADSHAPIGVMRDHVHKKGEWMLSYRFMHMGMSDMRSGTDDVSAAAVLDDYMVTPLDMDMQMHMFGAMYAPSDWLTLGLMLPVVNQSMRLESRMGVQFKTQSTGIADLKFNLMFPIVKSERHKLHLTAGFSVPTGSISKRDDTPMAEDMLLPYPMRLGSGTFDLRPSATYTAFFDSWSLGLQANGVFRLGNNSQDYRLGHAFEANFWLAKQWQEWFSTSLRLQGLFQGKINGVDSRLNAMMVPTANTNNSGHKIVNAYLGLNFLVTGGFFKDHRIAVELGLPVYQNYTGLQMKRDWQLSLGWQWAF